MYLIPIFDCAKFICHLSSLIFINLAHLHIDCSSVPAFSYITLYTIYLKNSHPYRVKQQILKKKSQKKSQKSTRKITNITNITKNYKNIKKRKKNDPFPTLFDTHIRACLTPSHPPPPQGAGQTGPTGGVYLSSHLHHEPLVS